MILSAQIAFIMYTPLVLAVMNDMKNCIIKCFIFHNFIFLLQLTSLNKRLHKKSIHFVWVNYR